MVTGQTMLNLMTQLQWTANEQHLQPFRQSAF